MGKNQRIRSPHEAFIQIYHHFRLSQALGDR